MHPAGLSIHDFSYELPDDRIARFPLPQREQSKLLFWNRNKIAHHRFSQLPDLLPSNALLVMNNSRVLPARLIFSTGAGDKIEIFCLEPVPGSGERGMEKWKCLVGQARKWKGKFLCLERQDITLKALLAGRTQDHFVIEFSWTPEDRSFYAVLESLGNMPIPPYLRRNAEEIDRERYQTVYSSHSGSVAAPTAGLHFSENVITQLDARGISRLELTLHVGAGTFLPVKSDRMADHSMHSEMVTVTRGFIASLKGGLDRPVIAVGTTALRALESLYWLGVKVADDQSGELQVLQWDPYECDARMPASVSIDHLIKYMDRHDLDEISFRTAVLIAPPYQLKLARGLVTNFHQPESTLLLLVAAVLGPWWKQVYDEALKKGYRFLSYGDSSLLLK